MFTKSNVLNYVVYPASAYVCLKIVTRSLEKKNQQLLKERNTLLWSTTVLTKIAKRQQQELNDLKFASIVNEEF